MGQGGAFGAPAYGTPGNVQNPNYINNPNQYTAFNQTPIQNMATANTNSEIGNQERQAGAASNGQGVGGSSGANATQRDIGSQGQQAVAGQQEQAAQNTFAQQLNQQNAQNQFNLGEQQNQNQLYGEQSANYNAQAANRQNAIGSLPGGGIVNLFGGSGGY